jgi:hypothetical protein
MLTDGDFWLGLDDIHYLTSSYIRYKLLIVIHTDAPVPYVISYDSVTVAEESRNYALNVAGANDLFLNRWMFLHNKPASFITKDHGDTEEDIQPR